ncbi:MAG TPA: hypothetical protein VH475_03735, partial [Tepidisphaeraceae bacterium]
SIVPEFMDKYSDGRPIIYLRANPAAKANAVLSSAYDPNSSYDYQALRGQPSANGKGSGYLKTDEVNTGFAISGTPQPSDAAVIYFTAQGSTTAKGAGTYILICAGADHKFGTADDLIYTGGGGQ